MRTMHPGPRERSIWSRRAYAGRVRVDLSAATIAVTLGVSTMCLAADERSVGPAGANSAARFLLDAGVLGQHVTRAEMYGALPDPADFGLEQISAFEENYKFVYLSGVSRRGAGRTPKDADTEPSDAAPILQRRLFLLKPRLLVVDDQVDAGGDAEILWQIRSPFQLRASGRQLIDAGGDGLYSCRTLVPDAAVWTTSDEDGSAGLASLRVAVQPEHPRGRLRMLHVTTFGRQARSVLRDSTVQRHEDGLHLRMVVLDGLTGGQRIVDLTLPDGNAAGKVTISDEEGLLEIARRRLPQGILPLGERGIALRTQWDLPYQREGLATWDTGRPSSELMRLVASGNIPPCRAVELGCGTGNDAIYLAQNGFDVTAIDISPTALEIAEKRAGEAGVEVRWLLADVLRPPQLDAFDFVYDRGCYHEVRRHAAAAYVDAVRDLTHEGSQVLVLAGNANKDTYWRFHGPPRVKEKEIRRDFARGFQLLDLREFRFDPVPREQEGPLAWSILLERRAGDQR